MNPISSSSSPIDSIQQVLSNANKQVIDTAQKILKASLEIQLGVEPGKGELIDIEA